MVTPETVARFLESLQVDGVPKNTLDSYRYDLTRYQSFLTARGIAHVEHEHIVEYLTHARERGLSPRSIERHRAAILQFHRFLKRENLAATDPTAALMPYRAARKLPDVPTLEKVERILAAPDTSTIDGLRDATMLELVFSSGLRVSELIMLWTDNVSLDRKFLRVVGKGDKERLIPFGDVARDKLKQHMERSKPKLFLFITRLNKPFTRQGFWKMFAEYAEEAGLPNMTPHNLRHAFGTFLHEGGANIRAIQEMLGHSSIDTTVVYTKVSPKRLHKIHALYHPREEAPEREEGKPVKVHVLTPDEVDGLFDVMEDCGQNAAGVQI